jgi:hypothetical protein
LKYSALLEGGFGWKKVFGKKAFSKIVGDGTPEGYSGRVRACK